MSQQSFQWRWVVAYPINGGSASCVPPAAPTVSVNETFTPEFSQYAISSQCFNGATAAGAITMLTGVATGVSGAPPAPATSIVPFNTALDWAGAAANT